MRHGNITVTRPIDNRLVSDKEISILNMPTSIIKKSFVKASTAKTLVNPPYGDKTCGREPEIRFYEIEDGYETDKIEEAEILVVYHSSLRHLSKTSSIGNFLISIQLIMRDPWLLMLCAI